MSVREEGEAWESGEEEHVRSGVWECEERAVTGSVGGSRGVGCGGGRRGG